MGLCKGNRGNLMQHWVLCEVLRRLGQQSLQHLSLTCTHSMAPWSVPERREEEDDHRCRRVFTEARARGAADRGSVFEEAWFAVSPGGLPYPSSAVLAQHVWRPKLSLTLC